MKFLSVLAVAWLATASAFKTPFAQPRAFTALHMAEKQSLFDRIAGMDLFAPQKDVNDYGARQKKNLKIGTLGEKSYIPNGLTKAQFEKIRAADKAKKDASYAKNVAKAGKFQDYTEFYKKRGTDTSDSWIKSVTRGHDMVKTKYDWSGQKQDAPLWAKVEGKKSKK